MASKNSLPPELKQYYQPSTGQQLRRIGLLILPLVLVVVLVGAIIGSAVWLTHRSSPAKQTASNASSQTSKGDTSSPTPTPSKPTPATSKPNTSGGATHLINTGPEPTTLLLPLAAAIAAITLYEIRQRRTPSRN